MSQHKLLVIIRSAASTGIRESLEVALTGLTFGLQVNVLIVGPGNQLLALEANEDSNNQKIKELWSMLEGFGLQNVYSDNEQACTAVTGEGPHLVPLATAEITVLINNHDSVINL